MKDILCATFNYGNCFYELFYNENNGFNVKKFVSGNKTGVIEDNLLIKKIIYEIARLTRINYGQMKYKNNLFNVNYNYITEKYDFEKNLNGISVPCNHEELLHFNSLFNEPVYYYSFDPFSTENNSSNPFSTGNNTSNPFSTENNSFDPFSTGNESLDPFSAYNDSANQLSERKKKEKEKKQKTKKIIITVGSIVVAITLSVTGIVFAIEKFFKNENNLNNNISNDISIQEIVDYDQNKIEEQIRNSLKEEEDWVVESIIHQYRIESGIEEERPVQVDLNSRAQHLLSLIDSNPNISAEDKIILKENFGQFFNDYTQYLSDDAYEDLCEKILTLNIIKEINDKGYINIGNVSVAGQYITDDNTIMLYSNNPEDLTHEFVHVCGRYVVPSSDGRDRISEGTAEALNPLSDKNAYGTEQIFAIILNEIYGRDFMMKAFFSNKNLFFPMADLFGLSHFEDNPHWNFIKDDVNSYLCNVSQYHYTGLMSEPICNDTLSIIEKLKTEYKTVTGKSWESNKTLVACFDVITHSNNLGLPEGVSIDRIYLSGESPTMLKKKNVTYSYTIDLDSNVINKEIEYRDAYASVDLDSGSYTIK